MLRRLSTITSNRVTPQIARHREHIARHVMPVRMPQAVSAAAHNVAQANDFLLSFERKKAPQRIPRLTLPRAPTDGGV